MFKSNFPTGPGWNPQPLQQQMEGEPAPTPPTALFDQEAFFARLTTTLKDAAQKQTNYLDQRIKALDKPATPPSADSTPDPAPVPPGTPPKDPHVAGLELQMKTDRENFRKQMDDLKAEREKATQQAEKENRESLIRSKLSKLPIREDAVDDAFALFSSKVTRAEDNSLIADNLPFDQYIDTQLSGRMKYLLKPEDKSGSGASAGQRVNGKTVDLNSISPTSTPEELAAYAAQIRAVTSQ